MKIRLFCILLLLATMGCQKEGTNRADDYPDQMGEIAFDPAMDDPDFVICNESDLVHSRTSLSYTGGRRGIEDIIRKLFDEEAQEYDFDGYISARFLVNCHGKPGRLRIEPMDDGFLEQAAPEELMELVRKSVMALDQWVVIKPANEGKDHSKYLIFKIRRGEIDAITH